MGSVLRRAAVAALLALVATSAAAAAKTTIAYAPVDRPGPALDVPLAQLQQAMQCTSNLTSASLPPVLFVTPTLVNPDEAFFGYEAAFKAQGRPYCTLTIPDFTTEDIQLSAAYVVYGIRTIHAETGEKVDLLGWSQGGGPEPRWALRFWPDIRPMVAKLIDLEAPNHGTVLLHTLCVSSDRCVNVLCPFHCSPAIWQQADNSQFTAALNSDQETFPGIAYTNIYSHTSQFVQPNLSNTGTTSLHGGGGAISNIALQSICPLNVADHLAYWYDPVAYALVMDALTHDGPADAARISRSVCLKLTMPYVSPLMIPTYTVHLYDVIFLQRFYGVPQTPAEPALKCYVFAAGCP